ncbi:cell number regulator 6 [Hordeum vulgare]|nr:cell number regulator 6 [Hordeum vulgare]
MDSRIPAREIQGTSQHFVLHVEMAGAKDFVEDDQEKIGHENVDIQTIVSEINEEFSGRQSISPGHPATRMAASKHKKIGESTLTYSRKKKKAKRELQTTDAANLAKKTHKGEKSTGVLVMTDTLKQQPAPLMRGEEGEDSKNRVSDDSSAGCENTESDNDFNPANVSDAGEDKSDCGNTSQKGRKRRRTSGKQSPLMIANEADKTKTDEKCQIKARATFVQVNEAWGFLKEHHRKDVKTAGFGSIEGCKIKGSINRNLAAYIYKNMDTNMMMISFGDGDAHKEIKITKEGIHKVFGYPNGEKKTTPRPMNCNESMKVLQSELGFRNTEFIHSDLIKKLKLLVEINREEENKKVVKIFFLIFFNKVVCGTTFPRYSREAVMVKDMNYEDMAQMDFCQVIVETIQAEAID